MGRRQLRVLGSWSGERPVEFGLEWSGESERDSSDGQDLSQALRLRYFLLGEKSPEFVQDTR